MPTRWSNRTSSTPEIPLTGLPPVEGGDDTSAKAANADADDGDHITHG